jgi:hypothetical protein
VSETKSIPSNASIWPAESNSSLICDGDMVNQIVDEFGVNVKIRQVLKPRTNEYGDAYLQFSDFFTKAYAQQWTADDDQVKSGLYKNGEITFIFKNTDESRVKPDYRVFFRSAWYRIMSITPYIATGIIYQIEARVEKMLPSEEMMA